MVDRTYRPRMAATLIVPVDAPGTHDATTTQALPLRVRTASLVSNDYNHADSLSITVDQLDAGIDPRLVSSATVEFLMANGDDSGAWSPSRENLRFVGILSRVKRVASECQSSCRFFLSSYDAVSRESAIAMVS